MIFVDVLLPYGGSRKWCHLISDAGDEELHEFARKIGLKREWFQNKRIPHYDITGSKRKIAVGLGATEVNSRQEFIEIVKKIQEKK